jgi:DNA-directed RNA polymerase subunit L
MSQFTCEINVKDGSDKNHIMFEILGNKEYGLNRTIVNAIRRTLLSSIDTYAFRTEYENSDIVIEKNNTSLHNEFILDRLGMLPLYIDPNLVKNNPRKYLFVLNVKNDNSKPITLITAENFDIYEIKKSVTESADYQNGMINNIDKNNYEKSPVSDKIKKEIFRPYDGKYYCLLHELKSTNSSENIQELVLYGSPSVSIAKENARWQGVSCATYSYKIDEELWDKIKKEKLSREDIPEEKYEDFIKDLFLKEGQRYYHRDNNGESYWYNFDIESQHFLNAKELFIRSNEILIDSLNIFKEELEFVLDPDKQSLIHFKYNNTDNKKSVVQMIVEMPAIIQIDNIWCGFDDTLGSILQSHISNHMINETSPLNVIGYKRTHPLEDKYLFTMSFNPKHNLGGVDIDEKTKTSALIQELSQACDELSNIFSEIINKSNGI